MQQIWPYRKNTIDMKLIQKRSLIKHLHEVSKKEIKHLIKKKVMILLYHHLYEDLKIEFLTVKNSIIILERFERKM
jgi:hypothetical protein